MKVRKTAKVDLFGGNSFNSIENAVWWLNTYAHDVIPDNVDEGLTGPNGLAEIALDMTNVYGGEVVATIGYRDNGFVLTAVGDQVGFLEFGTGIYADESHPLAPNAKELGIEVGAGTWSMGPEGAKEWAKVMNSEEAKANWIYNKMPRPGMLYADNVIREEYANYLWRAFNE